MACAATAYVAMAIVAMAYEAPACIVTGYMAMICIPHLAAREGCTCSDSIESRWAVASRSSPSSRFFSACRGVAYIVMAFFSACAGCPIGGVAGAYTRACVRAHAHACVRERLPCLRLIQLWPI